MTTIEIKDWNGDRIDAWVTEGPNDAPVLAIETWGEDHVELSVAQAQLLYDYVGAFLELHQVPSDPQEIDQWLNS